MPKISIATYSIRIKKRNTADEYQKIKSLREKGITFKEYIETRLGSINKMMNDDESKVFRIIQHNNTEDTNHGLIEVGEYGYTSKLYDVEKEQLSHKRSINEAELIPFYFMINMEDNSYNGYLMIQRFGNDGIKTQLTNFIANEFHDFFPSFTIKFSQIVLKEVAEKYINQGRLMQISFINYNLPSDIADNLELEKSYAEEAHAELIIKTKRRGSIPLSKKLKNVFNNNEDFLEITSFNYDTIKVKVELDGVVRTIGLEDEGQIRSYFDISDYVDYNDDGHPTYDSIHKQSCDILDELKRRDLIKYE